VRGKADRLPPDVPERAARRGILVSRDVRGVSLAVAALEGADADVRITDRKVSRRHASVFYSGTDFRMGDEGSANGTLLNGSKVSEYVIRDGDTFVVGATQFRLRRMH
jgi:pSer/pThr/pTyr-binding forkhead associated (FHA) protein